MTFTFLHWIVLAVIILLFILFLILIIQNHDGKSSLIAPILTDLFTMSIIAIFSIYILDKAIKVAVLENVVQKKILLNESFSISGQIRNAGKFELAKCTLEVKMSNNSVEKTGTDGAIFVPKSAFDALFKSSSDEFTIDTTKEFVIAEDLYPGEIRNFTVFMRYPASFSKPQARYELTCH